MVLINMIMITEDWICSSCKGKKGSIIKRNISIIVPNNNNTATHANNVATTNHNNVSTHNITTHADNTPTQTALEGKKLNEEDDGQSNELLVFWSYYSSVLTVCFFFVYRLYVYISWG